MVKLEDRRLAKSLGVFSHPSLVIFRQFGAEAVIYAGDLKSGAAVLEWLQVQRDPSTEAIEEVNGEADVRRLLAREGAVAVYICEISKPK
jgi:hypothetical protein